MKSSGKETAISRCSEVGSALVHPQIAPDAIVVRCKQRDADIILSREHLSSLVQMVQYFHTEKHAN